MSWNLKSEEDKDLFFMTFMKKSQLKFTTANTSSDGIYTVSKEPKLAKKPNQKQGAGRQGLKKRSSKSLICV